MPNLSKEGQVVLDLMKRGTLFYSTQQVPYMGASGTKVNINIGNTTTRKRKSIRYSARKSVHKRKTSSVNRVSNIRGRRHRRHRHHRSKK